MSFSGSGTRAGVALLVFVLVFLTLDVANAIERRRDQFTKEPGYYIIPMPYSLPGIGDGFLLGASFNNINETDSDVIGFVLGGAIEGAGVISLDNHLIKNRLIFDASVQNLSQLSVRSYNGRGMSAAEDDFSVLELHDAEYYSLRLTGTWLERMLEIYGGAIDGESRLGAIRDNEGNLIQEASNAAVRSPTVYTLGLRLDWTDDYLDPRRGVRYQLSRWWTSNADTRDPEYYQMEHNLTGYIPIGKRSTVVLNYFQSDANVTRQGEMDFATVEAQQGLNCSDPALSPAEQAQCVDVINNIIAHNTYGTAEGLGGWGRLRSYPEGRYKGAHTQFIGTEFRWNLTDEFTPFDIWIAKDVRTTFQIAFFYERGTVADLRSELGDIWRESYGIGARMVTAAGLVIRADIAGGDEGEEVSIIIGYPWESF